jgi:hypothetical protein
MTDKKDIQPSPVLKLVKSCASLVFLSDYRKMKSMIKLIIETYNGRNISLIKGFKRITSRNIALVFAVLSFYVLGSAQFVRVDTSLKKAAKSIITEVKKIKSIEQTSFKRISKASRDSITRYDRKKIFDVFFIWGVGFGMVLLLIDLYIKFLNPVSKRTTEIRRILFEEGVFKKDRDENNVFMCTPYGMLIETESDPDDLLKNKRIWNRCGFDAGSVSVNQDKNTLYFIEAQFVLGDSYNWSKIGKEL